MNVRKAQVIVPKTPPVLIQLVYSIVTVIPDFTAMALHASVSD